MDGGETNPYPIQPLVSYWETRSSLFGARLDECLRQGMTRIATFVPWQAVESDINHSLTRFLQAAADRHIPVSLILTPEVGVHYPNSGIPKDILSKPENLASHCHAGPAIANLPPNAFALPSLFAPDFTKRYTSFLNRMDRLLGDLWRTEESILKNVTLVLSGSFWKYIRSPLGGLAGDHSSGATRAYREALERQYSQAEFFEADPSAANRWKSPAMDGVNRRWFYRHSEEVFRARTSQLLKRKASMLSSVETEIFAPEADPSLFYASFLSRVCGTKESPTHFSKLSMLVDEAASRKGSAGAPPFVHWSGLGGFREAMPAEKQFLVLKSLLLMGGQGGGVLIDEAEWLSLSRSFRDRADRLAQAIFHGELGLGARATYLAPHAWSSMGTFVGDTLWSGLKARLGTQARIVSSLEGSMDCRLLLVDPSVPVTRDTIARLAAMAKKGALVALPRTSLYTRAAEAELEREINGLKGIEINLGIHYRLHITGDGKLLIYDLPSKESSDEKPWQEFLSALLSIADAERPCHLSDSRLMAIPMEHRDGKQGLFILNGESEKLSADLSFPGKMMLSDLAAMLAGKSASGAAPAANRFTLEVPSHGVLPLSVAPEKQKNGAMAEWS